MKNILITGCSRGIGFETVKAFAKNNTLNIFAISRDKVGLNKLRKECFKINNKFNVYTLALDVTDLDASNQIINLIQTKSDGVIDGIIHNAGFLVKKSFTDIEINDLETSFKINCFAPFIITQKLMPFFSSNAHVVSISSMGGVQGSKKFPGLSAYSTSKSTLITMTECLSEEFKTTNFKFNCLALGAVNTEMLNQAFPGYEAPITASEMGDFIVNFYFNGNKYFNGQLIPVSMSNP